MPTKTWKEDAKCIASLFLHLFAYASAVLLLLFPILLGPSLLTHLLRGLGIILHFVRPALLRSTLKHDKVFVLVEFALLNASILSAVLIHCKSSYL
jgi:hypothetical protein